MQTISKCRLILITIRPRLSRLERLDNRMLRVVEVFGRVLVFRRVAAAHVPADHADTQVNPLVAQRHALGADVFARLLDGRGLVGVAALVGLALGLAEFHRFVLSRTAGGL